MEVFTRRGNLWSVGTNEFAMCMYEDEGRKAGGGLNRLSLQGRRHRRRDI